MMFATILLPVLAFVLAIQAFVGGSISSSTITVAAVAFAYKKTATESAKVDARGS